MRRVEIPKKAGGTRTLYVPCPREKQQLRKLLLAINKQQIKCCTWAHGFMPGRSVVTNAAKHVGFDYTLSMDLKDFFDHVTPERVHRVLPWAYPPKYQPLLFPKGAARQGLPTSPALANIAGHVIDWMAVFQLGSNFAPMAYTRYADDISVSYNDPSKHACVKEKITRIAESTGFRVNEKKTHLQWSGAGRRVICGVAIDADGSLHATRKARRKLRAALHQDPDSGSARGLLEWAKLKAPHDHDGLGYHVRSIRCMCGGKLHEVSLYSSGELVLHNHPEDMQTLKVAFMLGKKPACMCHKVGALYLGYAAGPCPGRVRNEVRNWRAHFGGSR